MKKKALLKMIIEDYEDKLRRTEWLLSTTYEKHEPLFLERRLADKKYCEDVISLLEEYESQI